MSYEVIKFLQLLKHENLFLQKFLKYCETKVCNLPNRRIPPYQILVTGTPVQETFELRFSFI